MKTYEDVKGQMIEMTPTEKNILKLLDLYIGECSGNKNDDCDMPTVLDLKQFTLKVFAFNHGIYLKQDECVFSDDHANLNFGIDCKI
jgi:hypothetical protein